MFLGCHNTHAACVASDLIATNRCSTRTGIFKVSKPRPEPTACRYPSELDAEHWIRLCSGEVFALDIAFYRTRPRPSVSRPVFTPLKSTSVRADNGDAPPNDVAHVQQATEKVDG